MFGFVIHCLSSIILIAFKLQMSAFEQDLLCLSANSIPEPSLGNHNLSASERGRESSLWLTSRRDHLLGALTVADALSSFPAGLQTCIIIELCEGWDFLAVLLVSSHRDLRSSWVTLQVVTSEPPNPSGKGLFQWNDSLICKNKS